MKEDEIRTRPTRVSLNLGIDEPEDLGSLGKKACKVLKCSLEELGKVRILKRSLDARHGRVRVSFLLEVGDEVAVAESASFKAPGMVKAGKRVVIVGCGPAGLFCAHELARAGIASVVLERGKKVQARRRDLKGLTKGGVVNHDSNYCFGEGGAGTYSDGKLYTRAHKRGDIRDVMESLVRYGAPDNILQDARPHIGSNKLPKVVTAMRESLEACGVEFRFECKVKGLLREGESVRGVEIEGGETLVADAVVLATGHSARDVFGFLDDADVAMEAKGFAMGVRIEHPQPLINSIQWGKFAGHPKLPAASYSLVHKVADGSGGQRGVFSFCMCPGGWIVPASTSTGELVVNGMSLSKRDSPYANSGMVVSIEPADWEAQGYSGTLGGLKMQATIEKAAWAAGEEGLVAPAQLVRDFIAGNRSKDLPGTSYVPGVAPAAIDEVLNSAGLDIAAPLRTGLEAFGSKLRGYLSPDALLLGVESRTSAPVRVVRSKETLQSTSSPGLYPCGEGAGYAGGIVSAAMDGMRVARAISAF